LSAPVELPILKKTQKYRILQMTEQAAENSLHEGRGLKGCGKTHVLYQGTTLVGP
jgi:hypothetical protein